MRYRIEKDKIGKLQLPLEVYYGIHAARSKETFSLTKHGLNRQMIKTLMSIKKASAIANTSLKLLDQKKAEAIILSCDEIFNGRLHGQFVTDLVQGGSGHSMNMNANEVIANRANEMLGGTKGGYEYVSVEDVNLNQSSIGVIVLAGKITAVRLTKKLLNEAKKLSATLKEKIADLKIGEFDYENCLIFMRENLDRNIKKVIKTFDSFKEVAIGMSYFETKKEIPEEFPKLFVKHLNVAYPSEKVKQAANLIENASDYSSFLELSSALRTLMIDVAKAVNDLKPGIIAGKITIPEVQESPNPDEPNLIVLEMVNQISFYVMGNDLTVARAVEAGEGIHNIYLPMIYACLFEEINLIRRAIRILREKAIVDLEIKEG
ncbi:MAG TPA: hypothetical protein GXZ51_03615 [Acholeplasma sp.]|nr:hypothetical protein [Acholeplasma sp.]